MQTEKYIYMYWEGRYNNEYAIEFLLNPWIEIKSMMGINWNETLIMFMLRETSETWTKEPHRIRCLDQIQKHLSDLTDLISADIQFGTHQAELHWRTHRFFSSRSKGQLR